MLSAPTDGINDISDVLTEDDHEGERRELSGPQETSALIVRTIGKSQTTREFTAAASELILHFFGKSGPGARTRPAISKELGGSAAKPLALASAANALRACRRETGVARALDNSSGRVGSIFVCSFQATCATARALLAITNFRARLF
jgi:hypothetical protein